MKKKSSRLLTVINIFLPVLIAAGIVALFLQNYMYNSRDRVHNFSDAERDGAAFVFDDITVSISTRGGDSGSWVSDGLADDDGNIIYEHAVGVIYELEVVNNTHDTMLDWTAKVCIPEDMCVNNTWNGDFEYHQNISSGNERVQTLDLADYSKYDITLEHFMTPYGPFVSLYAGDYFIYYPDAAMSETPIPPKPDSPDKESSAKIGFIMYIPDGELDYISDFSKGEIHYHLQTSVFRSPLFWILSAAIIIWIICLSSTIIIRMNLKRFIEQQKRDEKAIEQTMQTFVNFIEAKDPSTMGHSLRVAQYSRMLAEKLGFSEEECAHIHCIALMHDCGKIYIPDEILSKPGKLTDEEYAIMKKHTVYGGEILRDFTAIEGMGTGALYHHERYDGKGYPNGLAGEDIPLIARIICVSDSFDAMNSRRCYRSSLSEEVILSELKNNRGKQFDPVVIDCLLALIANGAISMTGDGNTVDN